MLDNSLANRYADALYNAVSSAGSVQTAQQELEAVVAQLVGNTDVKRILFHPAIPVTEKKTFCSELLGKSISPSVHNFIDVLLDSKRIQYLSLIVDLFIKRALRENNRVTALVRTARPLSPELKTKIEQALLRYTGVAVDMSIQEDAELIGGISIQIGDKLIDGSVAYKLQKMTESLVS